MVTVEALLAPAVVSQVSRKLTDYTLDEVKLLCDFGFDLEITKDTLLHLDEHLRNLENSSFGSERKDVQHWLSKTKLLAYDIEDIVDEYYSSKEQFEGSSCGDKGLMLCSMSNPMLLKVCTAHKMKSKRDKLQRRQQLATQHHVIPNSSVNFEEKQTTSYTNDKIIGRDGDLEKIMSMLMQKNVEKISIIPIVGPVGFGKTSLARRIFNDCETKKKFKSRIWVYVSMGTINPKIVGKDIIAQSGGRTDESMQLELITRNVQCILNDNDHSCLIVLDNLWGKDEQVDELKQMLMTGSHTTSKIIVTTHSKRVAELISTVRPHKLAALSDYDCSTIFSQTADVKHNDPLFREYGEEIIRKCGGIPLVAKFFGSVVYTQRQMREVWLAARDKEMWKIEEGYPEDKILSVFTSLKLIYYNMPHALRLCFVYCSIFPKGSAIDKKKLVQQWIAHDMVDSKHGVAPPDVIAETYIEDLKAISFLQVLERNTITAESSSAPDEVLYMHSLAYELARSIANKDILVCLADEMKRDTRYCDYRYAQLSTANLQLINHKDWPWKLRSLIVKTSGPELEHLIHLLSVNKYLRVLDLSGCSINELPDPIFQLKQLRYLNASNLPITTLPPQMSSFQKLKTFDLSGTELEVLPSFVRSLKMLNYLNLRGCHKLRDLTTSLDMLHELHYLNLSCCPALGALPASLEKLTKLRFLNLSNCSKLQISPSGLLQSFVGFAHLEDLNLSGYEIQMLPDFFGSFYSLHFLNLSKCSMLSQLPQSFCELVNLKNLNLSFCSDLKVLHESFERLRSLQFLNLSCCSSLQYLPPSFGKLKNLKDLNLSKCSSLQYLPPSFHELENLKDLNLSYCCKLEALDESFGHLRSLQFLNLSNHSRLQYLPASFGKLENLKGLNLSYCYSLQYLPPSFCELANLKNLNLSFCTMLNALHESFGCLRSLQFLNLSNCSLLQDLPESLINLSSLEDLNLQCSGLKEFPRPLANHIKIRITAPPTYQDCIKLAGELHEETNLQISQLHRSLEQVVTDVTRGANDLDILEKKNLQDRMKTPMTPSSPSEKDRAEEPKDITKASSTSEASSSTPFPRTSLSDISRFGSLLCNGEITGEARPSGASFQSVVGELHDEAELENPRPHQSCAQSNLTGYIGSGTTEQHVIGDLTDDRERCSDTCQRKSMQMGSKLHMLKSQVESTSQEDAHKSE